jgi:hypothetical protein
VLCALDAINWGDILVRDGHGELRKALNKCYADDLLILAAKREALQQKADIMSAIAIIFKMKINTTKLRLFLLEHGDEHEPTQDPTLLLHVDNWEEGSIVEKEILREGEMKSLGFVYGMKKTSSQYKTLKVQLSQVCGVISRKFASPASKLLALTAHVYNKVSYVGKFGSWTLKEYRELDTPVNKCLRKITKNMDSFPTRLLYMQKKDAGLGMKKISDVCMSAKWSELHRAEQGDIVTKAAGDNLLLRKFRACGAALVRNQGGYINHEMSKDKGWWADSLVEWLGEMGMGILKGGETYSGTANEQLMLQPIRSMLTSLQIAQLNARSLRVVGDLVKIVDDEFRWIKGAELDLPWLDEFTAGLDLPVDPTASRYGQCWLANSESGAIPPGTIVEFLGRGFGDYCAVREWQGVLPYTGEERPQHFIEGESMSRGSGSNMVAKWSEIFDTGPLATRVHMSDYFKVKINEEHEASGDGVQRVGRFEYGVYDQPTPMRWPPRTQAGPT